jgi:pyruvate/2-oxoglutarate dehydrogenase complex dihydrolipoamide dehydrogenase (E3) component
LVLGAGLVGCETSDYLSEKGNGVILVEVLPTIATGSDLDTKTYFDMRFQEKGVTVYTNTTLIRIEGKHAILRQGEAEKKVPVDTIIFAVGADSNDHLDQVFQSSESPILKIGDCVKARSILEAVQEGFQAGRSI